VQTFTELKRRNVFRAGAFYAASAWLLVQVATQVFPIFHVAEWMLRAIVIAAVIGFPFAMLVAWFYEWTPQGFQRESEVAPNESITRRTGRKLDRWIIAILSLAVVLLLTDKLVLRKNEGNATHSLVAEKSIAVLPFENLSREAENAYFADGIQDEILSTLAKLGNLKVISRTSAAKYKSRPENLRQVGVELGAASLLEGSVQKAGERVRVIVQLIDAANDAHLWSETYDRELKDIFTVQSDIAERVASALRARLSPDDKQSLAEAPTRNSEAYQLYLRAGYFQREATTRNGDPATLLPQALELYGQAVAKDPSFALAWAQISYTHAWMHWFSVDDAPERVRFAEQAAQRALSLNPHLAETQLAVGYAAYWGHRDYHGSIRYFEEAHRLAPNSVEALQAIAAVQRRLGHWDAALQDFERAAALDPRNNEVLGNTAYAYAICRRYPEAVRAMDRTLLLQPDYWDALCGSAIIALASSGDVASAKAFLARLPRDVDPQGQVRYVRWRIALWSSDFAQAIKVLDGAPDWIRTNPVHRPISTAVLRGIALQAGGDVDGARREFQSAIPLLEAKISAGEGEPLIYGSLGLAFAGLGRKEEALRAGAKAVELLPISKDAFDGPIYLVQLAEIQARVGDSDEAIKTLRQLLDLSAGVFVSHELLRLDPAWDPLRNDERFQKLLAEPR
jgi:TolB-like protein/Flp pilus assembly protein TadD